MNRRIGLVIQGPLLSIGRAGNNLHLSPEELTRTGGIIRYDCRENINTVIREFGHLFESVVVSTWSEEVKPGESFLGATLVHVPDPGGIPQPGHYKDNNKFRQFLSTLNGLKELEREGVKYAVKIRTDSWVDCARLVESFFAEREKRGGDKRIIGTAVTHLPTFLIHDLYFMAETAVLREFCEAVLAFDRFEFIPSVHREMVLKHAYYSYRKEIGMPDWAYFPVFPPDGASRATRKVFEYMLGKIYFSLDEEIFRTTLWRGTRYEQAHIDNLVRPRGGARNYNVPALIATDWRRYYHFRRHAFGERLSAAEKAHASIGELGWKAWQALRRAIRMIK